MDFSGMLHSKIGGIPAPIIILGGGGVLGLYLRSRSKKTAATTGVADPSAVTQYGSLPTAIDPNSGAVYAIDPGTGRAFQLPWNGGAGSVPIGINNGVNTPTTPSQPTAPLPAPTPQPGVFTSIQPPPVGNVADHQGSVITSQPVGIPAPGVEWPAFIGQPVPVGVSANQALAHYGDLPQANYTTMPQAGGIPVAGMAGEHPFIYG